MSRRIAHRPRYRTMHQLATPRKDNQQAFLRSHWTYRMQASLFKKHVLGYQLSLLPAPRYPFIQV